MARRVGETGEAAGAAAGDDARQRAHRERAHALLLAWYARDGRATLPWRHTRDPYAVLVSEMMLQQTQVERVLPKYQAFLARFPTLAALAGAPTSDVIKEWAGLGYNLRAVRLQGIAQQAMAQGGELPNTLDGLLALKGIGRYTAGAVACFGLGLPVATVDTNIRRVLWRVFRGIEPAVWPTGEAAARAMLALAEWALPAGPVAVAVPAAPLADGLAPDAPTADRLAVDPPADTPPAAQLTPPATRVYDWQQALMDLGAMVCQARRPACERCPLISVCAAYAEVAAVTLFPSGEAFVRLRDVRDIHDWGARQGWHAPITAEGAINGADDAKATAARRVAERRAGYAVGATTTPRVDDEPSERRRPTTPAQGRGRAKAQTRSAQPFTTTSRYFRGRIVDALRALPAGQTLTLAELGPQIKADFGPDELAWLRKLVDGLARDGLARIVDTTQDGANARIALP